MRFLTGKFARILILLSVLSCGKKDQKSAQEQFRDRQRSIEQQAQPPVAEQETDPETVEPTLPSDDQKPATTAGDKVVAVKDGDTIELLQKGKTVTVRLYGVDAPEKTQDYGQKAKQFASDLVFGKSVRLISHNTDRYGRTVGTIILQDGRSLNEELIRNGYAWHYKAYSKDKNLENLEADARRFKRGLWQQPNPTPPWDYRKDKRSGKQAAAEKAERANAPLPAGATKRQVYLCESTGSTVYHLKKDCSVLKRCKTNTLTITEAQAIQKYSRRADKTCS
ncbi:thermonuclease family protein [Pontibacter arcticus]|uniref:SNase-like nuclease n=1 Tax=Pontibacter arcticus TaxID=2080288 RepID=A0A364RE19_9BACT|nr:thermonuclease family protein [Pontibacter arcticus]RAU82507.1 SNase-like nuclease [Pontibacter arcticus]